MPISMFRALRGGAWGGLFLAALVLSGQAAPACAAEKLPMITVHAKDHAYHNVVVSVALPLTTQEKARLASSHQLNVRSHDNKSSEPAQLSERDGQTLLTFLIADLPQGATRVYQISAEGSKTHPVVSNVTVKPHGDDLDVLMGTEATSLFTRYTTHSGPNKPFFYPILTPDGQPMTRKWPLESDTVETHDHPHHRGLWFTHGDINGVDFWSEEPNPKLKSGKTIAKGFENLVSGPLFAAFRTRTEWRGPNDKLIATDMRDVQVYRMGSTRLLDFDITLKPEGEPLVFGDTKEGMFGLRLPDAFAPKPGKDAQITVPTGHIESASGLKDSAVWGKPNEWVDDYGPIGGKTYGVAIFDNPQNLRHPQTWHARDYGLFTVNPFGLHDFGLGEKGAGDYTVPVGKTLTLRYRVVFHEGDTSTARIAEQYQNYADPPEIKVE